MGAATITANCLDEKQALPHLTLCGILWLNSRFTIIVSYLPGASGQQVSRWHLPGRAGLYTAVLWWTINDTSTSSMEILDCRQIRVGLVPACISSEGELCLHEVCSSFALWRNFLSRTAGGFSRTETRKKARVEPCPFLGKLLSPVSEGATATRVGLMQRLRTGANYPTLHWTEQ